MPKTPIDPSLAGSKFAPVNNRCGRCGRPTNTVSLTCHTCLNETYLQQQMERVREILRGCPHQAIEMGHGRGRQLHLVIFDAPRVAWCGAEITEQRSRRRRVPPENFPPELCALCRRQYQEVAPCRS